MTPPSNPHHPARPLLRRLLVAQESGLVLVIILLMTALTFLGGTKLVRVQDPATREVTKVQVNKFLDAQNLVLLAKDASFIAIMAVAMTAVIVMGGIDLSIGSIYALAAVLGAMALRAIQARWLGVSYAELASSQGGPGVILAVAAGILVCCGVGAACGAANGAMIVGLRVHPFIITLGMMAVLRGIVFVLTQGQSIFNFPESFTTGFFKLELAKIFPSSWHAEWAKGLYPMPVLFMLLVMLVGIIILGRTVLGRRTYAIGGNETAARYAGVPVGRVKIIMYTLMGAMAGLSACVYLGYLGAAEPNAGNGYELRVIAASVIGGASLSGGRGSALGAVLGAVLIQLISNAMLILEIDQAYTDIVMGAAIIAAVVLDQAKVRLTPGAR